MSGALSYVPERSSKGPSLGDVCYLWLCWSGWLFVTGACVVACWLMFFVFLGEFGFNATVLHVDNFASRYVAADAGRQSDFQQWFWCVSGVLFGGAAFFRRHSVPSLSGNSKEN
jgi:hypothetical protein